MSAIVIYLQHRMQRESEVEDKAIGFYSSLATARAAVGRLKELPGFRDPRGIFQLFECQLDQTVWPKQLDDPDRGIPMTHPLRDRSAAASTRQVYLLWNMNDIDSSDFEAMLGIYSSRQNAEKAMEVMKSEALLTATGREFGVDAYGIDEDHWREGFVSGYLPDAE
jgi:hypothetical protein